MTEAAPRDCASVPHRRGRHGLSTDELSFSLAALQLLIGGYSLEPGVRHLDAHIDALCRRASRLRAEGLPVARGEWGRRRWPRGLGAPRFLGGARGRRTRRPRAALSLAATDDGSSEVLLVEATCLPGGGKLQVTGTGGPMMRESARVAMTWVLSHANRFSGPSRLELKDGPSAGVTLDVRPGLGG